MVEFAEICWRALGTVDSHACRASYRGASSIPSTAADRRPSHFLDVRSLCRGRCMGCHDTCESVHGLYGAPAVRSPQRQLECDGCETSRNQEDATASSWRLCPSS